MPKINDIVVVVHVIKSFNSVIKCIVRKIVSCTDFVPIPCMSFSKTGVYNVNMTQTSDEYCIDIHGEK